MSNKPKENETTIIVGHIEVVFSIDLLLVPISSYFNEILLLINSKQMESGGIWKITGKFRKELKAEDFALLAQ